jgi:DNA-binding transcriptional regulator YiaG
MMSKTGAKRRLPADEARSGESAFTVADYEAADVAAREIRERVLGDPRARGAYDRAAAEIEAHQVSLAKLRKARGLAQSVVAEAMGMQQSEVSRLERRTDLLLSTMRKFVESTGGELVLVARYPEGDVQVITPGESFDT